ncbi:UbiH/UbiF/VisC/COQ6 family ubiquinone biosynthesis hydroxylase [Aestuariispira ectoiniformans]|uniref:UbiH/UbiF/VisC/COQ6 family ubiquinone biosynthesis hydroxylase n=1 Tax=Aestuariispira ectoiniformans TaxID=2775080 RepID=UPI00223A9C1E|nr:UbiH/UbiF/VisC/COQ6 family ubiquinone biosynthesis hydroxylase [Aestuariispira ectoiniformans]
MQKRYDVLIAGGGLVGMTLGCALASAGLDVAVIDREKAVTQLAGEYDGRASAISFGSAQVFKGIGLWSYLEKDASPIWDIRVADGHPLRGVSPLFLHYDHTDIGEEAFGYIIENRMTRVALHKLAETLPNLTLVAPHAVERLDRLPGYAEAVLDNGETIRAELAVACDGKFSPIRDAAGIKQTEWKYDQTAIVCTVAHERDHQGTAVELFLPGGPFAMLPMTEGRSNIVWSENKALVQDYLKLDDEAFLAELSTRFGDWLGEIKLVGPRFAYPLSLSMASTYIDDRLALAGDAGHAIHPIAGQGYNMGIRDVAALAEVLVDARRVGMDLGSRMTLENYEKWRRFDNVLLASVCDGLLRLFSNDIDALRTVRDLGLAAVDKLPPVKKFLMHHAMGVVGELPRLVRGEAL